MRYEIQLEIVEEVERGEEWHMISFAIGLGCMWWREKEGDCSMERP